MTADEVCLIITASAKAEVALLKLGDLHIEFARKPPEPMRSPSPPTPGTIPTAEMVVPLQEKESDRSLEMDELELRAQQLDELLITAPHLAEELIASGDLLEDDHGSNDSEE